MGLPIFDLRRYRPTGCIPSCDLEASIILYLWMVEDILGGIRTPTWTKKSSRFSCRNWSLTPRTYRPSAWRPLGKVGELCLCQHPRGDQVVGRLLCTLGAHYSRIPPRWQKQPSTTLTKNIHIWLVVRTTQALITRVVGDDMMAWDGAWYLGIEIGIERLVSTV